MSLNLTIVARMAVLTAFVAENGAVAEIASPLSGEVLSSAPGANSTTIGHQP
jgi:hypothetical protein